MSIKNFRILSIFEGISLLMILFISMPLKYYFNNPDPNKIIGMIHGVLFILYVMMAMVLKKEQNWDKSTLGIILLCSVVPFGTFWMDKKYLRA